MHSIIVDIATWLYAVASAAAFIFFGLNFGEEAVCGLTLFQSGFLNHGRLCSFGK